VEALYRRGVRDAREIVRRSGVSKERTYAVLRQLRGTALIRHWTAEEDALLGTMTDGAVGAKIGRTAGAVLKRREKLGVPLHFRGLPTQMEGRKAKN
jgi:hypothetical protein